MSPLPAKKLTPVCPDGVTKSPSGAFPLTVKLIDTTETPGYDAASCTAAYRSLAANKMMFAPGAITCDHSTSSEISPGHPWATAGRLVPDPVWLSCSKLGGLGRSQAASNVCKSVAMSGSLPTSTIAIVWPVPSPLIPSNVIPSP